MSAVTIYAPGLTVEVIDRDPTTPPVDPPPVGSYDPAGIGTIINYFTNTHADVNPCPQNTCVYSGVTKQGSLFNDTGMTWAPNYGKKGAFVFTGGGHNDYYGNEVYVADIDTKLVKRITDPSLNIFTDAAHLVQGNNLTYWRGYHSHMVTGELWADNNFANAADGYPPAIGNKATLPNQPGPTHLFDYGVYLPPGFGTTDPQGAFVTVARPALTPVGSASGRMAHILPLSNPTWSRFSTNVLIYPPANSGAFLDKKRRRLVAHTCQGNSSLTDLEICPLDSPTWATFIHNSAVIMHQKGRWYHLEELDLYAYLVDANLYLIDPETKVLSKVVIPNYPASTALRPGSSTWCEALGGFVFYAGDTTMTAYLIKAMGDPKLSASWVMTPLQFAGDAPQMDYSPTQSFPISRFQWTGDAFYWFARVEVPGQQWKLKPAAGGTTPPVDPPPPDNPPVDPPPNTATNYIDRSHPYNALTTTLTGKDGTITTLHWGISGNDDGDGNGTFIANGSFSAFVKGQRLVLNGNHVYARVLTNGVYGPWMEGTLYGPAAVPAGVTVVDPGPPPVPANLPMIGAYRLGELLHVDCESESEIMTKAPGGVALPYANEPEFLVTPGGMKYMRFSSFPAGERLIAWKFPFAPQEEVWVRYHLMPEHDVVTNMTEVGVKLPGMMGSGDTGEITWRMEHQPPRANGNLPVVDYQYDAEHGTVGFPMFRAMGGAVFIPDQFTAIEQYAKLNTFAADGTPNHDGIGAVRVNGHEVWRSETELYRKLPTTKIDRFWANVYHGGTGKYFTPPAHYRIACIDVSAIGTLGVHPSLLAA